jgi:hypothetical protein
MDVKGGNCCWSKERKAHCLAATTVEMQMVDAPEVALR